jgi:hypothetical protein
MKGTFPRKEVRIKRGMLQIFVDGDGEVRKTLASRTGEVRRELRCIVDGLLKSRRSRLALGSRKNFKALGKSSEQKLPES